MPNSFYLCPKSLWYKDNFHSFAIIIKNCRHLLGTYELTHYLIFFFSLQQYCEVSINMSILQVEKLSSQKLNNLPKVPKELVLESGFKFWVFRYLSSCYLALDTVPFWNEASLKEWNRFQPRLLESAFPLCCYPSNCCLLGFKLSFQRDPLESF